MERGAYNMHSLCFEEGIHYLCQKDKKMARLIERVGILKPSLRPDIFSEVIRHIMGQQISMRAQETVWSRWQMQFGHRDAVELAEYGAVDFQALGISWRKANYIESFIAAVAANRLDLASLAKLDDQTVIARLTALPGIGRWTAEMLLLFSLGRLDVFSIDDLGIQQGLCAVYDYETLTRKMLKEKAAYYAPYGSVASLYLWEAVKLINRAFYTSSIGTICIDYAFGEITGITVGGTGRGGRRTPLTDTAFRQIAEYLLGCRKTFDLPLAPIGTAFQKEVRRALLDIPYGTTKSYQEIAVALGKPTASRAVGRANHTNPFFIVVPCHRVIGKNGDLVGYAGGLALKEDLLQLEQKYK